jgi:predicted flap endonuclease-1-like 5' DNA nuclease
MERSDRSLATLSIVTILTAVIFLTLNNVVRRVRIDEWWLVFLLVLLALLLWFWVWIWPRRRAEDEARAAATAKPELVTYERAVTIPAAPAPVVTPAPVVRAAPAAPAPQSTGPDDLKVVEGIGPKMEKALHAAGIDTFVKLSQATEADIHAAIEAAGMRFAPSVPTWSAQAEFAAHADWDGLATYQQNLTAGRVDPKAQAAAEARAQKVADRTAKGWDDLEVVEGIGPKIEEVLFKAGITTFAQLAATDVDTLKRITLDAKIRLTPSIDTWAEQAALAAKGDWDALETMKARLTAGRRKS